MLPQTIQQVMFLEALREMVDLQFCIARMSVLFSDSPRVISLCKARTLVPPYAFTPYATLPPELAVRVIA